MTEEGIMKGKLIVFEGTDGSGKATQVKLLSDYLSKKNIDHEVISFPRYGENLYANLVRRYLDGEFGNKGKLNPYIISLAFAGDRALAKPLIEKWLKMRKTVIVDRYVSSSKAHMAAELPENDREKFIKWLDDLEYKTNKISREDLTVFLNLPAEISSSHMDLRKKDILEEDLKHQKNTGNIYLELAKQKNWIKINCTKKGKMKSKEEIHKEIIKVLVDYVQFHERS